MYRVFAIQCLWYTFFYEFRDVHCIFTICTVLVTQNGFMSFHMIDVKLCLEQRPYLVCWLDVATDKNNNNSIGMSS